MFSRLLRVAAVTTSIVIAAACGRTTSGPPAISLADDAGAIQVTGLSSATLDALENLTPEQWPAVLRVAVSADGPAMLGTYAVANDAARFTPAFPFDAGRQYHVTFDPARAAGGSGAALAATVGRPAEHTIPSTDDARVYPSGDVGPENLLRMYVEFSAPMGRKSGIEYMKVLNASGEEIKGAILPLDYEFWSPDHRRFTVFFDPGRVKDGILPNREMGRPLSPGGAMTLVVSREWADEHGLPLKEEFRRTFRVTGPDTKPLDTASWRIAPPSSGTRNGLVVTFPEPLDHGLLMRALGVTRGDAPVDGDIVVDQGETRWTFTPRDAWSAGQYQLLALDILEDLAGNQIGRAFEVDNFDTVDKSPNPETITLNFVVR